MDDEIDRKLQAILDARTRQEARHASGLHSLLSDRDDLRGVHALADLVGDRVRWCA